MVKKLGNYLRSNICVVILWCVVTALTVFGASGTRLSVTLLGSSRLGQPHGQRGPS